MYSHFSIPSLFLFAHLSCSCPKNQTAAVVVAATTTHILILTLNRRINWNNDLFLNSCCFAKRNVFCVLIKLHSIPSHYFPLFNLVLGCLLDFAKYNSLQMSVGGRIFVMLDVRNSFLNAQIKNITRLSQKKVQTIFLIQSRNGPSRNK